ncbi:thiouridylase [Treponema sp. OMZ 838]|uniref:tRNA 2-thiouridine(34) synthase MnmA n=1 Tax=Treponema sp. OMZ 838 TaxID=1539298 RepID=UPI0005300F36|nr:tRNA 2-thiouridine(34) synthase MnmA [Treponema sp. OMZ 838]AIW90270.1 thiouridylase [Treponema sp. OMZ 838]
MKIAVGLSGGVDSSVAAKLLIEQGYDVCGITLRLLNEQASAAKEQTERIIEEAAQAARVLGIPHCVYDFRAEFQKQIIDYFIQSYRSGETPNPCYICNKQIKFGLLMEQALREGFDAVATGHYAKVFQELSGRYVLERGADAQKDQSYFLALLSQEQLSRTFFPLAELTKPEVRLIAENAGLVNAHKSDSQDICFVPDGDYTAVIDALAPDAFPEGDFIDINGVKVGTHRGLHRYTIGQRRGLALPFGYPIYVVEKSAEHNTVTVGSGETLLAAACSVREVNRIAEMPLEPFYAEVKTRYRQQLKKARIEPIGTDRVRIVFTEPERAVACGQAAVFYSGSRVLGGGIIDSVESSSCPIR